MRHKKLLLFLGVLTMAAEHRLTGSRTTSSFPMAEPMIIDMNGDGCRLTSVEDGVRFDLNADGTLEETAWTALDSDDAFLAVDENKNGRVDSGYELLGGLSGGRNGFETLGALDGFATLEGFKRAQDKQEDGKIDASDALFAKLFLWTDRNHNGFSEEKELASAAYLGFVSIPTRYQDISQYDPYGNLFRYRAPGLVRSHFGVPVGRDIYVVRFVRK